MRQWLSEKKKRVADKKKPEHDSPNHDTSSSIITQSAYDIELQSIISKITEKSQLLLSLQKPKIWNSSKDLHIDGITESLETKQNRVIQSISTSVLSCLQTSVSLQYNKYVIGRVLQSSIERNVLNACRRLLGLKIIARLLSMSLTENTTTEAIVTISMKLYRLGSAHH